MNTIVSVYDLGSHYRDNAARALAVAMDWEIIIAMSPKPKGYHWTKQGLPDERYKNYPEVAAYHDAELEYRSNLINRSQKATP